MSKIRGLDAHETAPDFIKDLFKYYQKLPLDQLEDDPRLINLRRELNREQRDAVHVASTIPRKLLNVAYGHLGKETDATSTDLPGEVQVYAVDDLPGESSDSD